MTDTLKIGRNAPTLGLVLAAALCAMTAALLALPAKADTAGCASGSLIKGMSLPAVYYCGADGKRYVFTNDKAYFTWYQDFSGVISLSDAALAEIPIGGNVTYRPGKRMVKIQSDPKVYVIARGGELRPIPDEACAVKLYGADWNAQIDDLSDAFFVDYKVGTEVAGCDGFDKDEEARASASFNDDRHLGLTDLVPAARNLATPASAIAPLITAVSPVNSASGVPATSDVTATFSAALDPATMNATTFTLTKSGSDTPIAGTVNLSGMTARFHPSAALEAGASYDARITTGAASASGVALEADRNWSFTVAAAADVPTVLSVTPASGASGVELGTEISATFSETMDMTTFNGGSFKVMKGDDAVPGAVTLTDAKATFTPAGGLEAGETYTVHLSADVKDMNGNALSGGAYTWSFTAGS